LLLFIIGEAILIFQIIIDRWKGEYFSFIGHYAKKTDQFNLRNHEKDYSFNALMPHGSLPAIFLRGEESVGFI